MTATMTRGSLGCLPRFATPRSGRETLGAQVGEVARRLGFELMPWQQQVADVALEVDEHGRFVYDEIDLTVPRQSGKTALVKAKTVRRLVVAAKTLGPQRSTYTAQTRAKAREKLERDFAEQLRSSRSFREVRNQRQIPKGTTEFRLSLNNGSEHIRFGSGSYWTIDAPTRTGTHGDTLDDGTIDEAFVHETDDVEGAMRPAQATRVDAQIWVLSTAGDHKSKYLWRKITAGRAACELGTHGRVAYFEWSAPDDADPSNPHTWRACSPALGHTIDESFLRSEWERACRKGQEGVDTFRRAYLNQWPEVPILDDGIGTWHVVNELAWASCRDITARPAGALRYALDCAEDGAWTSVACSDGTYIQVVANRPGVDWVADECARHGFPVTLDPAGPAGMLIERLERAGVTVRLIKSRDYQHACAAVLRAVTDGRLRHIGQPELDKAAALAERRTSGDSWRWSRRMSRGDISPLVAATLAYGSEVTPEPGFVALDDYQE